MEKTLIVVAVLICLGGCKSGNVPASEPRGETSITEKVEAAGISSAELDRADAAGLQLWLSQHKEVARSIASQCKAAMKDDTSWKMSNEGRICLGEKFAGF